jgi:hypothetical protein
MKIIASILLFLLITACGGGGNNDDSMSQNIEKTPTMIDGVWTIWSSKASWDANAGNSDDFYYVDLTFSRYGAVAFFHNYNDFITQCFGQYEYSSKNISADLKCHDEDGDRYLGEFSGIVDNSIMDIEYFALGNKSASYGLNQRFYKKDYFFAHEMTNIRPGIYEVGSINMDAGYVEIKPNGQISTILEEQFVGVSGYGDCQITGYIEEDPDYGLSTENSEKIPSIATQAAILSIYNCELAEDSTWDINQTNQPAIMVPFIPDYIDVPAYAIDIATTGNTLTNNGINSFWISEIVQICDQFYIPTDYALSDESGLDENICELF